MLCGDGNENGEKTTIGLISKRQLCMCSTRFFVYFLAVVLHDYSVKLLESSINFLVTRFMGKLSYAFFFTFFPLPLIFTLVAASISHFLTTATKFNVVLPTKNVPFVFYLSL